MVKGVPLIVLKLVSFLAVTVMFTGGAYAAAVGCYDVDTLALCGFGQCSENCRPGVPDGNGGVIFYPDTVVGSSEDSYPLWQDPGRGFFESLQLAADADAYMRCEGSAVRLNEYVVRHALEFRSARQVFVVYTTALYQCAPE